MGVYDVIIVGSGPAGATAAYFLGQTGLKVLVLDKAKVPRYKACGGGLSEHVLRAHFPFSFEPVIESRVSSVSFALGRRTLTQALGNQAVCTVMRDRFDAHILAHSQAEVHTGEAVRSVRETDVGVVVETQGGARYDGRYLIGADGSNSVVARSLGLRRHKITAAAIEAEIPAPGEVLSRFGSSLLFIFGEVRMGYLWIFPKAAHLSVGIGALRPRPGELQAVLRRVMARYGLDLSGIPLHGHPIPVFLGGEPVATGRSLLVGDAAGLADPLTGEGIRLAIKSGRMAAEAILAETPAKYARELRRRIGRCHEAGLALTWLFYHFPGVCLALGARNPFVTEAFADMLADRTDYPEVMLRMFVSLPLYWLTEGAASLAGLLGRRSLGARIRGLAYGPADGTLAAGSSERQQPVQPSAWVAPQAR